MTVIAHADTVVRQWKLREKFRDSVSAVRARIITAQAGHEANVVILRETAGNGEVDREVADALVEDLGLPAERELVALDRVRKAARHLVRRHRAATKRVAEALLEREILTGVEVDAILPTRLHVAADHLGAGLRG